MSWVLNWSQKYPDRFFYYFQNELNADTLKAMAGFLDISPDERWLRDARQVMEIKGGYHHSPAIINAYKKTVADNFAEFPEIKARFEAFLN